MPQGASSIRGPSGKSLAKNLCTLGTTISLGLWMKSKTAVTKYYQLFFFFFFQKWVSVTQCSVPERLLEPQIHHKIIKQTVKSWVRGAGAWRANVLLGLNSFQLETTAQALLSSRFIVYRCDFTGSVWHRFANLSRGKNPKCGLLQQAAFKGAFLYTWKLEFSRISTRNVPPTASELCENCKRPLISHLACH